MTREVSCLYSCPLEGKISFLIKTLKGLGLNYEKQLFSMDGYEGKNILVRDYYKKKQPTMIISSHYDGFGAYDNAGGVVALLWVIRWTKLIDENTRKLSIIFVFLDAEERNLMGAKHFLHENSIDEICGHISLDGFGIGTEIGAFANLKEIKLKVHSHEKSIAFQADTTVFQANGIPSLHLFTLPEKELLELVHFGNFPDTWRIVHTNEDTPEKVDGCFIPFVALNLYKGLPKVDFRKKGLTTW